MMGLADALAAPDPVTIGVRLRVDVILDGLDDRDRAALDAALRDPVGYPNPRIARAIRSAGETCSPDSVKAWRERNGIA